MTKVHEKQSAGGKGERYDLEERTAQSWEVIAVVARSKRTSPHTCENLSGLKSPEGIDFRFLAFGFLSCLGILSFVILRLVSSPQNPSRTRPSPNEGLGLAKRRAVV